jgi:alpha-beta hydrolase superfamily lysophospholipase
MRLKAGELSSRCADRLMNDPMVLHRISPAALLGLFNLVRRALDKAPYVRIPVLTMAGTKDDLIGTLQIRRLHDRLGGQKEWVSFEQGPHLLLHWKYYNQVLKKVFLWIEARLPPATGPRESF